MKAHKVPEPGDLSGCHEFKVKSKSCDPHLGGEIDVRLEVERIGLRWSGEESWTWMEWHEVIVLAGDCGPIVRQLVAEKQELGYEEGLKAGIEEALKEPLCEVRRSKLWKMPSPEKC